MAIFERSEKLRERVTVELDGESIEAEKGEPLAISLLAASKLMLARSPKLHRPRGPSCLRGDCDGCIARVNGVPNVMLCLREAQGGERIERQNVLGAGETDLLRVTDWFFPKGIDHHHLMAGIPGVHAVMQTFARKLAGIGRLPEEERPPLPAEKRTCDVLVVGAGLSGTCVASNASAAGLEVIVADDARELGGSGRFSARTRKLLDGLPTDRVATCLGATVAGIYDGEAMIVRDEGALLVRPRILVLATGAHDGVIAVPNNDLPGVMSARSVLALQARGVAPATSIALVGEGFWIERCAELFAERIAVKLATSDLESIEGSSRVKGVRDRSGNKTSVGLVAIGAPGAPSFELCEMAGAKVEFSEVGYRAVTDADGRAGENVFAVGECTGAPFDPPRLLESAKRASASIVSALR